jgi:pyruvate ferredoxin oxidoreductase gamma subunit
MQGIGDSTVMLMYTNEDADVWKRRLNVRGPVVALPRVVLPSNAQLAEDPSLPFVGSMLAGAAARLVGAIPQEALSAAVRQEVGHLGLTVALENERHALAAFAAMAPHERAVAEAGDVRADRYEAPQWIDLGPEEARLSDPAIHASATSVRAKTGAWRTMRPVVDESRCNRCWWICSTFCPDSAIAVSAEGKPVIDYDHCKGCMICVAICPTHVIAAVPETGGPTGEPRERCAESS